MPGVIIYLLVYASVAMSCLAWSLRPPRRLGRYIGRELSASDQAGPPKLEMSETCTQPKHDLWIVGGGHLGGLIAQEWLRRHPASSVVAETMSSERHDVLRKAGVLPRLRKWRGSLDAHSAANVIVCIPPSSGYDSLTTEIKSAFELLSSGATNVLVYTSSTVVYGNCVEGEVTEETPLNLDSERAIRFVFVSFKRMWGIIWMFLKGKEELKKKSSLMGDQYYDCQVQITNSYVLYSLIVCHLKDYTLCTEALTSIGYMIQEIVHPMKLKSL